MTKEIIGNVDSTLLKIKWEIDNFSVICNNKNVGDCLESPKFTADSNTSNIQWNLLLYPKGQKEFRDHLGLFLHANIPIAAIGTFFILNNEGKVMLSHYTDVRVFGTTGWGTSAFVTRAVVTNPMYGMLNNDKLIIACEVAYTINKKKYINVRNQVVKDDVSPRLEEKYEALLTSGKFSDVSLISEGKTMNVHKCILAQSSPVFAAMFDAEMKEKQENIVEIADVKYDVLLEMIRFVYAAKVKNIDTLAGELATAADKYALDDLKNLCEKTMKKNLSLDNVIGCLQLADKLRMDELKIKAIEFIVESASDVSDKPEFKLLSSDIMYEVFRGLAKKNK